MIGNSLIIVSFSWHNEILRPLVEVVDMARLLYRIPKVASVKERSVSALITEGRRLSGRSGSSGTTLSSLED